MSMQTYNDIRLMISGGEIKTDSRGHFIRVQKQISIFNGQHIISELNIQQMSCNLAPYSIGMI
jgi:hypothetical protein